MLLTNIIIYLITKEEHGDTLMGLKETIRRKIVAIRNIVL